MESVIFSTPVSALLDTQRGILSPSGTIVDFNFIANLNPKISKWNMKVFIAAVRENLDLKTKSFLYMTPYMDSNIHQKISIIKVR